jgi:hypothetical protein
MRESHWIRAVLAIIGPALLGIASFAQSASSTPPAVRVDPITTIIEAFQSHHIVALGEGTHGGEQDLAFRQALIRDPRFALTVNDIVVETGNSRCQDLIDRFVHGENVSDGELRQVWENTTVAHAGADSPVYEAFYRTVRTVNGSLPKERQLRVLLGDPPIDWKHVQTYADIVKWGDERETFAADLIRREVVSKQRRALVVYGVMHSQRKNERTNYETADFLTGLLENDGATKVFAIWTVGRDHTDLGTLQTDVVRWPIPSLAILRGTVLGALDFASYFNSDGRLSIRDGKIATIPRDRWQARRMEHQFDAVLYLGPPSAITVARLSPARCSDQRYMEMRLQRMALDPATRAQIDGLKQYCASVAPK